MDTRWDMLSQRLLPFVVLCACQDQRALERSIERVNAAMCAALDAQSLPCSTDEVPVSYGKLPSPYCGYDYVAPPHIVVTTSADFVLMHELGHAMHFSHVDDPGNIMFRAAPRLPLDVAAAQIVARVVADRHWYPALLVSRLDSLADR